MRLEVSSILELPDTHKIGHTCANLNGELLFIWGGSNDKRPSAQKDNKLWIYETLTGYWRSRVCSGECPLCLSGATSVLIAGRMYVFGGLSLLAGMSNTLYCLDLETFIWKDLGSRAEAEPTNPIPSDKAVSWSYKSKLYIFGGYGWSQTEHLLELLDRQKDLQLTPDPSKPICGWNNQLVEFDVRNNKWLWPSYTGKCPSARAAHSGALMGSKYYLFGGRDSHERLNDLYIFDMPTFKWTQITTFSDPLERLEHPIGHLLESSESDDTVNYIYEAQALLDNEIYDEDQEFNVEDDSDMANQISSLNTEEELTPSPSSSNPCTLHSTLIPDYCELDDDESDYSLINTHQVHLLEFWSLPPHQPASSTANQVDCSSQQSSTSQQNIEADQLGLNQLCIRDNISLSDQQSQQQVSDNEMLGNVFAQRRLSQQNIQQLLDDDPSISASNSKVAPLPIGRSFSSFTPVSDIEIILFGGVSSQDENLADCWMFNIETTSWIQLDLNIKHTRMWHTASRTKNNEVIVIGGSCSDDVYGFCSDVLTISLEPNSLKKLALDTVARSIRMRSINRMGNLTSTLVKLIKLRKQAMALTMRRYHRPTAH